MTETIPTDMNGNELITITISDVVEGKEIRLSTRYGLSEADLFNGTKGEFHLMHLDNLVRRFKEKTSHNE